MNHRQKVLAITLARGGSKEIPRKNILDFCGKPLIAWTIEMALASKCIDKLILSSDDEEIISVATSYGCDVPFTRDSQLALDDTPSIEVVLDAINRCPGYEWIVLLQPTSPLRTTNDIDDALNFCIKQNAVACVSVSKAAQSPYWMYSLTNSQTLTPLIPEITATRRQELPPSYALNGAIYLAKTDWLLQTKTFVTPETLAWLMPLERSIDIDSLYDFKTAEFLYRTFTDTSTVIETII